MVNYNKSSIYKLCCKDINIKKEYVGSTTRFERRKNQHKSCCHNEKSTHYTYYVYQFIRKNGGFQNWEMIQIEEVNVNNKRELDTRERYWIETLKAELNIVIPTQTDNEWREKNKESLTEKGKIKNKEYYEKNKEIVLEKHKIYRENNREMLAEKSKQNHEKSKIIKIKCECGSTINKHSIYSHIKSKKHLIFIDQFREQTSDNTVT